MGIKWYGKDTTLSGVFGAMGAYLMENNTAVNKASKGSNSELEELKKGMHGILPDLSSIIDPTDITADIDAFIKDRLMIKNGNHDNARLWQVVYQLRNSIVHNKESELHFMYANTNVYEPGINLMKY